MEQGAKEILAKHGCLYMKDDYKALFEELEAYYKPTEAVKNNAVLPFVSDWLNEDSTDCGCEPETCKMLKGKCKNLAYR